VSADGAATEVARLRLEDLGSVSLGPGLRATSMTYKRAVVIIDLATKRLTRVPLAPDSQFASEVRAGAGWVATLSYVENRSSKVRFYRLTEGR
jgi:hypothetical protein